MSETLDAIGDRMSPGRMMQRRKNRMRETVHSVRERVMGTASEAQHAMSEVADDATDAVKQTPSLISARTQGAPMVAGAIAFGTGFLLASVFSPSEPEKRASAKLMEKAQPAKDQLMETAQEVGEHLKQPAQEAVEQVKQTATEGAASVADTAKQTSPGTDPDASRAATEVRHETFSSGSA